MEWLFTLSPWALDLNYANVFLCIILWSHPLCVLTMVLR